MVDSTSIKFVKKCTNFVKKKILLVKTVVLFVFEWSYLFPGGGGSGVSVFSFQSWENPIQRRG